jgi:hypothetical protein
MMVYLRLQVIPILGSYFWDMSTITVYRCSFLFLQDELKTRYLIIPPVFLEFMVRILKLIQTNVTSTLYLGVASPLELRLKRDLDSSHAAAN